MFEAEKRSAKNSSTPKSRPVVEPLTSSGEERLSFQLFTQTRTLDTHSEQEAISAADAVVRAQSNGGAESASATVPAETTPNGSAAGALSEPTPAVNLAKLPQSSATTAPFGIIVEDGLPLGDGQLHQSEFMELISTAIERTADEELASVGQTAHDCPYLAHWLRFYRERSAAHIERAIQHYARPERRDTAGVQEAVVERVRTAVQEWIRSGGQVVQAPAGVSWLGQDDSVATPTEDAPAVQMMPSNGAAGDAPPGSAGAVRSQLAEGRPLDGSMRGRMERGFGRSFADVRLHTDSDAARLATSFSARAFTVGSDVAFGAGQYRPGTLAGDLLIAHELAHVVQQGQAAANPSNQQVQRSAVDTGVHAQPTELETEADRGAVGAILRGPEVHRSNMEHLTGLSVDQLRSHSELQTSVSTRPGGLRLQRCKLSDKPEFASPIKKQAPTTLDPTFATALQPGVHPEYNKGEFLLDGDGDQSAELKVRLQATQEDKYGEAKRVRIEIVRLPLQEDKDKAKGKAAEKPQSAEFDLSAAAFKETLSPAVMRVTDGHAPTTIGLYGSFSPGNTRILLYPPKPDPTEAAYRAVLEIGVTSGTPASQEHTFHFPREENERIRSVFRPASPQHTGEVWAIDMSVGAFGDPFRLTFNKPDPNSDQTILGITSMAEGKPAGGERADVTVAGALNVKIISNVGATLVLDLNGDGKPDLHLYDRLTEESDIWGGSKVKDVTQHRDHMFTATLPDGSHEVLAARFQIRKGQIEVGFTAGFEREFPAASHAMAIDTLPAQTELGSFLDQVAGIETARQSARESAAKAGLISKDIYDPWKALSKNVVDLQIAIGKEASTAKLQKSAETQAELQRLAAVKAELQKSAAANARTFLAAMEKETAGAIVYESIDTGGERGISTQDNPYTGWGVWTTDSGAVIKFEPTASLLAKEFEAGRWGNALTHYSSVAGQLDGWVIHNLRSKDSKSKEATKLEAQIKLGSEFRNISNFNPTPVAAVFHSSPEYQEHGAIYELPLLLFYWKKDNTWYLRDLTNPKKIFTNDVPAKDGETQPPHSLFLELNRKGHFVKGFIHYQLPGTGGRGGRVETTEPMEWSDWFAWAAGGLAAAGFILATAGAGTVLVTTAFALSGVAGAVSAGFDIKEHAEQGTLDSKTLAIDVVQIIASLASAGSIVAKEVLVVGKAAAAAQKPLTGSAALLQSWAGRTLVPLTYTAAAGDVFTVLAFVPEVIEGLKAIDEGPGTFADKMRAKALLIFQVTATTAMTAISIKGAAADIRLGMRLGRVPHFDIIDGVPIARYKAGSWTAAQYKDELRAAMKAPVAKELGEVPVHVVDAQKLKELTGSVTGQAVVRIEGGKPVVYVLDGVHPSVFKEEVIHLEQLADPKMKGMVQKLDESVLKNWDTLKPKERIDLVRVKLDLEIDAQKRIIRDLGASATPGDAAAFKQIDDAWQNLEHLRGKYTELEGLDPKKLQQAGAAAQPTVLDQPPRLFSKATTSSFDLAEQWKHVSKADFVDAYRAKYPNTSLSKVELRQRYQQGQRLNPASWHLKDPTRVPHPEPDVRATYKQEKPDIYSTKRYPSGGEKEMPLEYATQKKWDDLLKERDAARVKRNQLEAQAAPDEKALAKARYEVNEASRKLGELAAEVHVKQKYPGANRIYPDAATVGSRSGDFDQVWEWVDKSKVPPVTKYIVVEAKGGSSELGSRMAGDVRAQQGTRAYYDSIVASMLTGNDKMKDAAKKLVAAPDETLHYIHVKVPIVDIGAGGALNSTAGIVKVNEFDLKR